MQIPISGISEYHLSAYPKSASQLLFAIVWNQNMGGQVLHTQRMQVLPCW